jgi:hypothetical protein
MRRHVGEELRPADVGPFRILRRQFLEGNVLAAKQGLELGMVDERDAILSE